MASLMNKSKDILVCSNLQIAKTNWERMKGLLGRKNLSHDSGLWINPCSSIHTFFMQFPIDVAFVDKNLKVTKITKYVLPGRILLSTLRSKSVFEFSAGVLDQTKIEIGDLLHVDY